MEPGAGGKEGSGARERQMGSVVLISERQVEIVGEMLYNISWSWRQNLEFVLYSERTSPHANEETSHGA